MVVEDCALHKDYRKKHGQIQFFIASKNRKYSPSKGSQKIVPLQNLFIVTFVNINVNISNNLDIFMNLIVDARFILAYHAWIVGDHMFVIEGQTILKETPSILSTLVQ